MNTCIYKSYICKCMHASHVYMYICMYVCMYGIMHVCYVCIYLCMEACMHVCMVIYIYGWMYLYTDLCNGYI